MAKSKIDEIRQAAEADLETFIRLVHPNRVLGAVHCDLIRWWQRDDAKTHQLVLLPRDHQKSAMVGYRVAHAVVRNPTLRVLYLSATSNLAIKQLKFIKDILTCDIVRKYWPELINLEEAKREKWTETEISVDHPLRKAENVRDPTIFTGGLTTTVTGLHADIVVLDDVVIKENAYTEEGRTKVSEQYSLLASVASGEERQWVVGTRYHPKDLYDQLLGMKVDTFDDNDELAEGYELYEIFERQVENRGDGTGEFIWPVQYRHDGKRFGFDKNILAKKKAQYIDRVQFQAQYYNNPNDPDGGGIGRETFQYYDRKFLTRANGQWFFKGNRLNLFAAVDFAYSLSKEADSTAIVVVGIDAQRNYYVLDIDRFKGRVASDYFRHILDLHRKWDFRKMRAEVTAAQLSIVETLKHDYIRVHGLALSIDDYRPNRTEGNKQERIKATLQDKYANRQMWHYQGGYCQTLEEELMLDNPPHDDVKDALASCVQICIPPSGGRSSNPMFSVGNVIHPRFGGVA